MGFNKEDIAWAAGFLEGEGSFKWPKCYRNARQFEIRAAQQTTNIDPLLKLQKLFGGTVAPTHYKETNRECSTWTVTGQYTCYAICAMLYTFMSSKRQEHIKQLITKFKECKHYKRRINSGV